MFFPSSSQQLQDLKFQALSTKMEIQTAVQVSHPACSCLKSSLQNQVNIFLLETVRQRGEKMPAVCLKEDVVVCMSCPALRPVSSTYLQLAVRPVPCPQSYGPCKQWTEVLSS